MNQIPNNQVDRRKNAQLGWILAGIALFMFVSFIVKTALRGP